MTSIGEQIINELHISPAKIMVSETEMDVSARNRFLDHFSEYAYAHNISGSVQSVEFFRENLQKR